VIKILTRNSLGKFWIIAFGRVRLSCDWSGECC